QFLRQIAEERQESRRHVRVDVVGVSYRQGLRGINDEPVARIGVEIRLSRLRIGVKIRLSRLQIGYVVAEAVQEFFGALDVVVPADQPVGAVFAAKAVLDFGRAELPRLQRLDAADGALAVV